MSTDKVYDELSKEGRLKPYEEGECRHDSVGEIKGVMTCLKCSARYSDSTCEWENV
jgi:hypothetical protein